MEIKNSDHRDIENIIGLYRMATTYMKSKNQVYWPEFSMDLITNAIDERRQWKLVKDEQIACIWTTTLNDDLIWVDNNAVPSLYLHRITTHPNFRGQNLVRKIIDWGNEYAKSRNLNYLRMDTVGLNTGLINHYKKLGFDFLGSKVLNETKGLPDHYKNGEVCYFQKTIL